MSGRTVAEAVERLVPGSTVASDRDLLRKALLALQPEAGEHVPRWSLVRSALGHGSTVGGAICRALEIDPDEDVYAEIPQWIEEIIDASGERAYEVEP